MQGANRAALPARSWRLAQVALSLLLLAAYLLIYAGRFHVIDEVSVYAMSESLAKRGTLDTDQILWTQWVRAPREVQGDFGPDGTLYSKRGFGTAFAPALFIRLALAREGWGLVHAALLTNAFVTALTAVLLAALVRRLGHRPTFSLLLGGVYGLATLALPYARTLFGEPVSALALVAAAYSLVRSAHNPREHGALFWAAVAAIALSFAMWVRLFSALAAFPFALYLALRINGPASLNALLRRPAPNPQPVTFNLRTWRPLLVFAAVTLLFGLGGNAWYNAYRFGSPFTSGYQFAQGESFITPLFTGLYGLLLSPFRGLFWFSPVLLAALPGTVVTWRRDRALTLLAWGVALVYLLPFSMWWMWWGGFAWGPRFLLPVVPFLLLLTAPLWEIRGWRPVMVILAAVSLGVQFLAVAADFTLTETVIENAFGQPAESAAMVDPRWSPIVLQARYLAQGFWDIAWASLAPASWPVLAGGAAALLAALLALLTALRQHWLTVGLLLASAGLGTVTYATGLTLLAEQAQAEGFDRQIAVATRAIEANLHPGDTMVSLAPYDYPAVLNWLHAPVHHIGLAPHRAPLHEQEAQLLGRAVTGRVWLLAPRVSPADINAYAEQWLSERGFVLAQQWHDETRVVLFAGDGPAVETRDLSYTFEGGIQLTGVILHDQPATAGGVLRVETRWRADSAPQANYTLFLHLLTPDGRAVAGYDGPPAHGYRPTAGWLPGEVVTDRRGLMVPPESAAGVYALEIGLYDPATGARLPVTVDGELHDRVLLGEIGVTAPP
jgi:hypothetical protein